MASVCREPVGSATCTTLAGAAVKMEIYPVGSGETPDYTDPVNKFVNPVGVVIYADDKVTKNTAAVIELTKYLPTALNLKPKDQDDPLIQWSITSQGGSAKFFQDKKTGQRVRIYGVTEGEILVEADYGWVNKAQFRAVVVALKQIKFRVSRISGPTFQPVASVQDIKKQIRIANIYLRQVGLKLVPDDSVEMATAAGNPNVGDPSTDAKIVSVKQVDTGYFEVQVNDDNLTNCQDATPNKEGAIRVNGCNEILNLAYVYSIDGGNTLGEADLIPVNHAPGPRSDPPAPAATAGTNTITDNGTPSSSWIAPNGLPDNSIPSPPPARDSDPASGKLTGSPAATVVMKMMGVNGVPGWQSASSPTRDTNLLWGLVVDGAEYPAFKQGNSLAHEFGHCLGLRHRNGAGNDTLRWPVGENLMDGKEPPPKCQNLDIIQCKAVRFSEFLFRPNAISGTLEIEPSDQPGGLGSVGRALVGGLLGAVGGALVGAAIGAAVGFIASGGHPAGAVAGALVGAAIGAGVGAVAGAIAGGLTGSNPILP